jgi:lipopolysaccharide transport system permease protein
MRNLLQHRPLARNFLRRELQNRYVGTGIGAYLALVQPLLQLAVYTLIFSVIFKADIAELNGRSFVLFFALGLWPWLMLREGAGRATQCIVSNAALVGKVAFPRELLVLASVAAAFLIHLAGFVLALIALALFGEHIVWSGLPTWSLLLMAWFALALALGLLFSAVQVYWRELDFLLDSMWLLAFYCTPILFSLTKVPEVWRTLLQWNPLAYFFTRSRDILLGGQIAPHWKDVAFLVAALVTVYVCHKAFARLAQRFDDAI